MAEQPFRVRVRGIVVDGSYFVQTITPIRSVDGKMIRRSGLTHCAARVRHQHMGLLKSEKRRKRSNNIYAKIYAKFAARPPWHREHGRRAAGGSRSLALPGSKDRNRGSATPSDARGCRRIIVGPPQVVARRPAGAACGTGQIARCEVAFARPGASSRVARWGRNVPTVLGMKLSRLRDIASYEPKIVEDRLNDQTLLFG